MTAALEIGREPMRPMRNAGGVEVGEAALVPVGTRHPAEEMIERSVFHHHHDDVFDARCLRRRQGHTLAGRGARGGERSATHGCGRGLQEATPAAGRPWSSQITITPGPCHVRPPGGK